MPATSAKTATEYLAGLPPDRKALVSALRKTIRQRLPKGYREMVNWGMLAYCVPLSRYPETYNGQPLCYAALASQKNYVSVHLVRGRTAPYKIKAAAKDKRRTEEDPGQPAFKVGYTKLSISQAKRQVAVAVKRAREVALLPYSSR